MVEFGFFYPSSIVHCPLSIVHCPLGQGEAVEVGMQALVSEEVADVVSDKG